MNGIHRLSDELGTTYNSDNDSVRLYDNIEAYSPRRITMLTSEEMGELITFYLDGCCPVCFSEMPDGDIICDSCFSDAATKRSVAYTYP